MADVRFSKFMVTVLRHSAKERGIQITRDGYVDIEEILALPESGSRTIQDVEKLVRNDNKGRFTIKTCEKTGRKQIRATQGHTMKLEDPGLIPITSSNSVRAVLHGTRSAHWSSIKEQGLSRMRRQHIHFAEGETGVKSGFPPGCNIVVEINLQKALRGGIQFFKSENGVILSEGNDTGHIPTEYFRRVYNLHSGDDLPF